MATLPTNPFDIPVEKLTEAKVNGDGVFDVLMQSVNAHLDSEFRQGRIKGAEYATVYLGSLQSTMDTALQFLLQQQKAALEAQLIEQQIRLAEIAVLKANVEMAILEASLLKVPAEIALLEAQTAQAEQQTLNLISQELQIDAQTALLAQQKENAILEGAVLVAQECKLRAEFDLVMANVLKSASEQALLDQKVVTERAQTDGSHVTVGSVIGRQMALYQHQAEGYLRDAEQKAAKIMADTWNVRRTTDEDTEANATNQLHDASVGRVMSKLMAGVGA